MSQEFRIYGLQDDWCELLSAIEACVAVQYHLFGHFGAIAENPPRRTFRELSSLGVADSPASVSCRHHLITADGTKVEARRVGSGTSERWSFDQLANPGSVTLTSGGLWDQRCVIVGRLASATDGEFPRQVMRAAKKHLGRSFEKVQAHWVGPDAYKLFTEEARLTMAVQSPPSFDLRRP